MKGADSSRGWTLRGRMLKWMGLTSCLVALALSATGVWFVNASANRQIEALLIEELDEARVVFAGRPFEASEFMLMARALNNNHPGSTFAWRVWDADGEEILGVFGVSDIVQSDAPAPFPLNESVTAAGDFRWRSTRLQSGEVVGLIVNEEPHRVLVDQYVLVTILMVIAGFGCIFLVGQVFSARVSELLARIANRAREAQANTTEVRLATDELPREISDVAQALEESLHSIRAEMKSSRVLIAGMAHELRAPIQNLIGETEVALMESQTTEGYREVLGSHLDEMRHLGDAVHNLVALCSARNTNDSPALEAFDLFEEARFRLERELHRAERLNISLKLECEGDLQVRGDREALLAAIRNLTSNALDWTPDGGAVEVRLVGDADRVSITVDDSGNGVPEADRPHVFEPFFRGPSAEGRRIGYGLGLALTARAISDQGGTLVVEDSTLGGARFRALMPKVAAQAAT